MAERKTTKPKANAKGNEKILRKASTPALEGIADTSPPPTNEFISEGQPPEHDRSQEANKNQG